MKKTAIRIGILLALIGGFVILNIRISMVNEEKNSTFTTANEFLKTIDCAPIFDVKGEGIYRISFYAKAEKGGKLIVEQENGRDHRYSFFEEIDVSTEYKEYSIDVCPKLKDVNVKESYLSFYGVYGTGVVPTVKYIKIEKIK